ncbi:MAG: hypothetical protein VKN15_00600 [Cyanobacteriota bacterium]|nr:hypothetical protein [Cyanobacteriota bacterium]
MEPPLEGLSPPSQIDLYRADCVRDSCRADQQQSKRRPISVSPELPKLPMKVLEGGASSTRKVIDLEKYFLAKQIRNRRTLRPKPGALVLLRVFNPRQPA